MVPNPSISHFVVASGAHKPEKATSMYSCQGVFTNQVIFKSDFGANLEYLVSPTNQSANPSDLKMVSFSISYTLNELDFAGKTAHRLMRKVNLRIKTYSVYQLPFLVNTIRISIFL